MKILFVAAEPHLAGHGGAVTYTGSIRRLFATLEGAQVETLALPLPWRRLPPALRRARAMLAALLSGTPSKSRYFLDRRARRVYRATLRRLRPDIVVINSADLLPLIEDKDEAGAARYVLVSHNVETEIIRGQIAATALPAPLKRLLARDVAATQAAEAAGARRMALIVCISHDDACWYREHAPGVPVIAVPGAFDGSPWQGPRPALDGPLRLAMLANMDWWPNLEGAGWLVNVLLPRLEGVEVHLYGPGSERYAGRHPMLHAHGYVESLDTIWRDTHIMACPIFSGSGVNVKLVEALFHRVPVLATPHARRGLPPLDDPALMVLDPQDWAAFLASPHARALAETRVAEVTAQLFAARSHRAAIAAHLGLG
ncbi:hypothetical protein B2G71_01085 [Novosphingobium sp. PC22D]|uniref:glycosyltransferase n=1 Tax=Novosphingobium sp. PC22D TaxID=1962403 RepID=UPI000BEFD887|nr:glycosyltransferase [Novosphingobium sp. PC22D]PEQ14233.1 hypothetical protein B2G71_01085 [Novosphingobium sp. PC22D]